MVWLLKHKTLITSGKKSLNIHLDTHDPNKSRQLDVIRRNVFAAVTSQGGMQTGRESSRCSHQK